MFGRFRRIRSLLSALTLTGVAGAVLCPFPSLVHAQQARTANDAVYTATQASRGQALYQQRCAMCHGEALGGGLAPPLTGSLFLGAWGGKSLWELTSKIRNTMPADDPGKLTLSQSADLAAVVLQAGKFPSGQTELAADEKTLKAIEIPGTGQQASALAASPAPPSPVTGNMQQLMAAILFPSSNIIFNVQTHDPGAPVKPAEVGKGGFSWVDWGAGIYSGWDLVDNAAVAISESAPLLLTPRRCQNGRPAPVDRPDWIKFTQGLAEAGRAAYKASQTRSQDAVSDVTNQLADACQACHRVYRDKPGRTTSDPSNKAARCIP
jgi:S-disulfanyl-L-cysteine oxidoreductase SoxD